MQWGHHSLHPYSATWANQRGNSTRRITLDAFQVRCLRRDLKITLEKLLWDMMQKHSVNDSDSAIYNLRLICKRSNAFLYYSTAARRM